MEIVDPALPAVVHLTGPGAIAPLTAAVAHAGGTLHDARVTQVQYRPGADVVVRYRCDISWPDGRRPRDILFASAHRHGTLPGTIPVVAPTDEGDLAVSVWRWPFDPVLPGLGTAVTSSELAAVFDRLGVEAETPELEVVAHRATERAVVRVGPPGRALYVKVVPPETVATLAKRHHDLGSAGVPVPPVLAVEGDLGLLVLGELRGATLRDHVRSGAHLWPDPAELRTNLKALSAADTASLPVARDRIADAVGHAELLRAIAPERHADIDAIVGALQETENDGRPNDRVVHGDLHESQLIVDETGSIAGLLDIDDVGLGHAATDPATLIAHLRFRALTALEGDVAARVLDHTDRLRDEFVADAPDLLDRTVAAVLVGLATGPFRIQRAGWRDDIVRTLDEARRWAS